MTLKYALYGLCFGWLLLPRWRTRGLKVPLPVIAYATSLIAALIITYCFQYNKQAWIFVLGMSTQLIIVATVKWVLYFAANLGRKIRR